MYKQFNANPIGKRTIDCTVRAISKAIGYSWRGTYAGICLEGYDMYDMPSSNAVWGSFLRKNGFNRYVIPNTCPDCYTIADFCDDHPLGTFILATGTHVVAVENGDYYDTWDSGDEIPIFYWKKEA